MVSDTVRLHTNWREERCLPPITVINAEVIKARTGKTVKEHLADCIPVIETVKDNEILRGLAELLPGEKEKMWIKTHLRQEAVFLLKNYQSVLRYKFFSTKPEA